MGDSNTSEVALGTAASALGESSMQPVEDRHENTADGMSASSLIDAAAAMDTTDAADDLGPRRPDAKRKASPSDSVESTISGAAGQSTASSSLGLSGATAANQAQAQLAALGALPPPTKKAKNIEERLKALNASLYKVDRRLGLDPRAKLESGGGGSPLVGAQSPGSPAPSMAGTVSPGPTNGGAGGSAGGAATGGVGGAYPLSASLAGPIKKTPVVKFKSLPPVPASVVQVVGVTSFGSMSNAGTAGGAGGASAAYHLGHHHSAVSPPARRGRGRPPSASRHHHEQVQYIHDGDATYVPEGSGGGGGGGGGSRGRGRHRRRNTGVAGSADGPVTLGVYVAEVVDIGVAPGTSRALERCYSVLLELMRQEMAWPFNQPVDPIALGIPDYYDIIKHPMDLGTIKKRLEEGAYYNTVQQFAEHVRLVWSNAFQYNQPQSDICYMAQTLSQLFETRFAAVVADEDGTGGVGVSGDNLAFPAPYGLAGDSLVDDHHHHHAPSCGSGGAAAPVGLGHGGGGGGYGYGSQYGSAAPASHLPVPPHHHHAVPHQPPQQSPAVLAAAARAERKRQMKETIRELRDAMSIAAQQLRDLRIQGVSTSSKSSSASATAAANAAAAKAKKRKKYSSRYYKAMSFDEKAQLSEMINSLNPQYVAGVVAIMEEELPSSLQSNAVELELDIDALDTLVLRRLEAYVKNVTKPPRKSQGGGATASNNANASHRAMNGTMASVPSTTAAAAAAPTTGGVQQQQPRPAAATASGGAAPMTPTTPNAAAATPAKSGRHSESSDSESSSDSDSDSESDDDHLAMAGMGARSVSTSSAAGVGGGSTAAAAADSDAMQVDEVPEATQQLPVLRNIDMWSKLDDGAVISTSTSMPAAAGSPTSSSGTAPTATPDNAAPTSAAANTGGATGSSVSSDSNAPASLPSPVAPSTGGEAGEPAAPALWSKFAEKAMHKQQLEAARAEQEEKLRRERQEQQQEEGRRRAQQAEEERKRLEQADLEKKRQEEEMRRRREEERRKRESTTASVDMMGQGVAMGEFESSLRASGAPSPPSPAAAFPPAPAPSSSPSASSSSPATAPAPASDAAGSSNAAASEH